MTKKEALKVISDGHSMLDIDYAKEVCKALGVEFSENLITKWLSQVDANPTGNPKGLWLEKDEPGEGVASLRLSNYITDKFGLKVEFYHGRGFQAQANSDEVRKHLGL